MVWIFDGGEKRRWYCIEIRGALAGKAKSGTVLNRNMIYGCRGAGQSGRDVNVWEWRVKVGKWRKRKSGLRPSDMEGWITRNSIKMQLLETAVSTTSLSPLVCLLFRFIFWEVFHTLDENSRYGCLYLLAN